MPPSSPAASQVLDLKQISSIQRLLELSGEPGLLAEMVEGLLADVDASIARASEAAERGDAEALQHIAHKLKGACGNLGARHLMDAWGDIEAHALACGDAGLYAGMLARVAEEAERARVAFLAHLPAP